MGLLGKEVRSSHELKSIPIGTPGRVVRVRLDGKKGFCMAVQWQCKSSPDRDEFTKAEFQRFVSVLANPACRGYGSATSAASA